MIGCDLFKATINEPTLSLCGKHEEMVDVLGESTTETVRQERVSNTCAMQGLGYGDTRHFHSPATIARIWIVLEVAARENDTLSLKDNKIINISLNHFGWASDENSCPFKRCNETLNCRNIMNSRSANTIIKVRGNKQANTIASAQLRNNTTFNVSRDQVSSVNTIANGANGTLDIVKELKLPLCLRINIRRVRYILLAVLTKFLCEPL
mmetsp:Transcript_15772/g.30490  ORF Transcript_15772/g.30490 Transcript_15772/m.30490 type:complete len:209 (+) Transcript_15772:390-1016(+)